MELTIEGIIGIITLVASAFAFCVKKELKLTKDIATLAEKHQASKFSLGERITNIEEGAASKFNEIREELKPMKSKITELDKEVSVSSVKLDNVLTSIGRLESIVGKIFDIMDKKQDKIA